MEEGVEQADVRDGEANEFALWQVDAIVDGRNEGDPQMLQLLLDGNGDATAVDSNGRTLVVIAAETGNWDYIQFLVEYGADFNVPDMNGTTALMHACESGVMESVKYLIEIGASVNAVDAHEETALMRAAKRGMLSVVQFLIDMGADVAATDTDGDSALIFAAKSSKWNVAKILVERGADINTRNNIGMTILMYAAENNEWDIVQLLVMGGAKVDSTSSIGRTVLMYAAERGELNITQFLLQNGADANLTDQEGHPAIFFAHVNHHFAVERLLHSHILASQGVGDPIQGAWSVSPFDIQLLPDRPSMNIGGEYMAKWLDANVAIKLFVASAAAAKFSNEVTIWHQTRHPHVIKLYGACNTYQHFFICEYASNGSLGEYLTKCEPNDRRPWKFLYETALGLAYLHERGILHRNLRGSSILIGSDGLAKVADFELSGISWKSATGVKAEGTESIRWLSPERLRGEDALEASDVYSFGLCIVEAITGRTPWKSHPIRIIRDFKRVWDPAPNKCDCRAPAPISDTNIQSLISRMCAQNPKQRVTATGVVRLLEKLAAKEASELQASQPQLHNPKWNVDEYRDGVLIRLFTKIHDQILLQHVQDPLYEFVLQEIEAIHEQLAQESHLLTLLEKYYSLLKDLDGILQLGSLRNQVVALSSTRAAGNNLSVVRLQINDLWMMLDESRVGNQERERQWDLQRKKQMELFVSEASKTVTVLSELDDVEERATLIALLKLEIETRASNYTERQLAVLKKAYDDCCQGERSSSVMVIPMWYLAWYELAVNKFTPIGSGGFGEVYLAKWLGSEVVVKEVKPLVSSNSDSFSTIWSLSASQSASSVRAGAATGNIESRKALRAMFEQEVNVWFGLSHPHVIRLFGACHVGTPFFACEYAAGGSLDKYLRKHPDEIWLKLFETALGVQYLQSRNIIHGDLKCNNIVIGNDGKAKVTDFGLSSFENASGAKLSGAWQWVAPECIKDGVSRRSFASDVYSLGMCIVEALRVVEKVEDAGSPPLPWGDFENALVKYYVVSQQRLPPRPQLCTDQQWQLVERMCAHDKDRRIKISSVVDELAILAQGNAGYAAEEVEPTCDVEAIEPKCDSQESRFSLSKVVATLKGMCFLFCDSAVGDVSATLARSTEVCAHEEAEPESEPSLSEVITAMKDIGLQFYDRTESRDRKVLCKIYELLWERLAHLTSATEKDEANVDVKCLGPLIERARKRTLALETQKDTLSAFTETAFGGYALHRDLEKLIDAKMWVVGEDVRQWRDRCWKLLTVRSE